MLNTKSSLLIVDDESAIRTSLALILSEIGYSVRIAEDGLSAWEEIRQDNPQILLSDLNMPGMTGFELLAAVRRKFPAIRTIAMSGAFEGNEVPSGVAADAFYQKGSSLGSLLMIIEALPQTERHVLPPCANAIQSTFADPLEQKMPLEFEHNAHPATPVRNTATLRK
jgi:CheY-like chemotaxis protein